MWTEVWTEVFYNDLNGERWFHSRYFVEADKSAAEAYIRAIAGTDSVNMDCYEWDTLQRATAYSRGCRVIQRVVYENGDRLPNGMTLVCFPGTYIAYEKFLEKNADIIISSRQVEKVLARSFRRLDFKRFGF